MNFDTVVVLGIVTIIVTLFSQIAATFFWGGRIWQRLSDVEKSIESSETRLNFRMDDLETRLTARMDKMEVVLNKIIPRIGI